MISFSDFVLYRYVFEEHVDLCFISKTTNSISPKFCIKYNLLEHLIAENENWSIQEYAVFQTLDKS